MQRLRLIALVLGACATSDSGDTGETGEHAVNPSAPVVTEAKVTCYEHLTGETFTQWTASASVEDRQGLSTIEPMGGRIEVSDARGDLGELPLVCADGACTSSWKADDGPDIECDTIAVGTYDFAFIVVDIDGHEAVPLVVHGEKTTEGG